MNQNIDFTAKELVNTWSKNDIARIIRDYGEENGQYESQNLSAVPEKKPKSKLLHN